MTAMPTEEWRRLTWDGEWFSRQWQGLAPATGKPLALCCDHDSDDPVCPRCVAELGLVLDDVPALLFDLDLARTKDVTFVEHGVMRSDKTEATTPQPWNDRASKAYRRLVFELSACASAMGRTGETALASAEFIRDGLTRLARFEHGPEFVIRLSDAVGAAHRAIDRPPSPWYYGPCPLCHHDIYAERISDEDTEARVTCIIETCKYEATLHDHRVAQLNAGENRMLTVAELVGAITSAGETVTRDQINGWIRRDGLAREWQNRPRMVRGRLVADGDHVYKLGDVRRLAMKAESKRAEAE